MKQNLKEAVQFTKKVKNIVGIKQIVLFGSVARGEDRPASDVDLAIIYDNIDKFELMKKVNQHKTEKIQLTYVSLNELPEETELCSALAGEGLILSGRPIIFKGNLSPWILIIYSLVSLPQTEKVKVNRALYGSVSTSMHQGKKYQTITKGQIAEPGIEKISKGVLLVKREKATKIINTLKLFKVKVKEILFWR